MNRDTPPFVLKRIIALLQSHLGSAPVVASCLWILLLTVTERPTLKQLFGSSKGMPLILDLLEKYKYVFRRRLKFVGN
jgi:hypothetical protein